MNDLTLQQLVALMEECGDRDSAADEDLAGATATTTFDELGFDSLALLNTSERLERDHTISLSLDDVLAAQTVGDLLELVNTQLRHVA